MFDVIGDPHIPDTTQHFSGEAFFIVLPPNHDMTSCSIFKPPSYVD